MSGDKPNRKPRLLVDETAPDETVIRLRDVLRDAGGLYERGGPVIVGIDPETGAAVFNGLSIDSLILHTHKVCRPFARRSRSDEPSDADVRLPSQIARSYLDFHGHRQLPVVTGITAAPLLRDDGQIVIHSGYDAASRLWCSNLVDVSDAVPERPASHEAEQAVRLLRNQFASFCFNDAKFVTNPDGGRHVDLTLEPGDDESALLVALLTAVCRPSLQLAPGIMITAPALSGAGAGKGLLARCISLLATGFEPHAVTSGTTADELEKRVAAELIACHPVLFLDNLNNASLTSDLLASATTETTCRIRILGQSRTTTIGTSALVILTGNGLRLSEDLLRRFVSVELNPRIEDPEARRFSGNLREIVRRERRELLAAALTIWRWGRLTRCAPGQPIGSFEQWSEWVRDPLLALGCRDPVSRIAASKRRDPKREELVQLFEVWFEHHGENAVPASELHDAVIRLSDPHRRSRQQVAARLSQLDGTCLGGFRFSRQTPVGHWGRSTYRLQRTGAEHRGHRGHALGSVATSSDGPDAPYALKPSDNDVATFEEGEI